jgi:hypothetical protein
VEISLESEIANYLRSRRVSFADNRESGKKMDFVIRVNDVVEFHLEAKEKRQRINTSSWPRVSFPERELFIVDELTVRKMIVRAPACALVIRDNLTSRYFFCSVADLVLMPHVRANRMMDDNKMKGKWLVDLRNMAAFKELPYVFSEMSIYINNYVNIFSRVTECYGTYFGETIPLGGELRTKEHRTLDYNGTR